MRLTGTRTILGLLICIPLLVGGCPNLRDDIVGVLQGAALSSIASGGDTQAVADDIALGFAAAFLDFLFEPLRSGQTP
jgi:hypothetical protein